MGKYARVIGVIRASYVVENLFDPAFVLQEDDTLLVLGDPSNLGLLENRVKAA